MRKKLKLVIFGKLGKLGKLDKLIIRLFSYYSLSFLRGFLF